MLKPQVGVITMFNLATSLRILMCNAVGFKDADTYRRLAAEWNARIARERSERVPVRMHRRARTITTRVCALRRPASLHQFFRDE